MVPTENPLAAYPPELIDRVAEQAARDAELNAHFLEEVGLLPLAREAPGLPSGLLLALGAAMRLRSWESLGMDLRAEGLPTAREALFRAFREAEGGEDAPTLGREVFPLLRRAAGLGRPR